MQEFIPIPGYESIYSISMHGEIKVHERKFRVRNGHYAIKKERLLKPTKDKNGYFYVDLHRDGIRERAYIHRFMLLSFVSPEPNGMEACHNDGNPENNIISNLRWDTHKNNLADKKIHGTQINGAKHALAKLVDADIYKIYELRKTGLSHNAIAIQFGVCRELIGQILRGKKWIHITRASFPQAQ